MGHTPTKGMRRGGIGVLINANPTTAMLRPVRSIATFFPLKSAGSHSWFVLRPPRPHYRVYRFLSPLYRSHLCRYPLCPANTLIGGHATVLGLYDHIFHVGVVSPGQFEGYCCGDRRPRGGRAWICGANGRDGTCCSACLLACETA